ncbi:HEAT repeat domain-containing protein [Candidatus Poribacteria bacterium]|nr:HEAT repeat domain-containing protein [Candidatus Poribacteria bacterium]
MARIVIKERGLETKSLSLGSGSVTIGRTSKNDIVLNNRYVSGRHCEIVYENNGYTVIDLKSTNGVFVNGHKVESKKLDDGDRLLVGAGLLIYVANEQAIKTETLMTQLENGSADERELAANLLGQFGTLAASNALLSALSNDLDPKVKAAAAEALGLLGDSRAVRALLGYFDTSDVLLRNSVVRSLVRIADDKTIDGIAAFLKHEDSKIRVLAAYTLGRTRNTNATQHLVDALNDETYAVREAVIKALGDIEDARALSALTQAANDPHRFPQLWVIESLGRIRSPEALPVIIKALKDPGPEVREAAAAALGKLRATESARPLISALADPDQRVRKAASISLEKIRTHVEMGKSFSSSHGRDTKTMHISRIGESEEGESGAPLFGEDRAKWLKWWMEQQAQK